MIELSTERVEEILQKETQKTVDLPVILRAVYTRYMNLYERYFTDVDNLNDDKIAELRKYHEETISLVRYYYMDISDIERFALEMNRDHSVVFEIASKYYILDSFVDHDDYSISSQGFLPTGVDIVII